MRNLTVRVFEHLKITSPLDVDKRVNYMQRLLRWPVLNTYKTVLVDCKESEKGIYGYQWTIVATKDVTMEQFWTW